MSRNRLRKKSLIVSAKDQLGTIFECSKSSKVAVCLGGETALSFSTRNGNRLHANVQFSCCSTVYGENLLLAVALYYAIYNKVIGNKAIFAMT